jgi:MFS family permease
MPSDAPNPYASPDNRQVEHDAYAALRVPSYRFYLVGNVTAVLGMQMQGVAVGWEILKRTGDPWSLAIIGLVQVLPVFALTFLVGYVADRFDRRRVLIGGLMIIAAASFGMAITSHLEGPLWIQYLMLFFTGVGRAFQQPLKNSLLPLIVPRSRFPNAVTWSLGGFQFSSVMGPVLGGAVLYLTDRAAPIYMFDTVAASVFALALTRVVFWNQRAGGEHDIDRAADPASQAEPLTLASIGAGLKFVWNHPVILGAMWLDMFAVLFGGAVNLFPIYASDILMCGATGLGLMRAAPAVGSLTMSLILAHQPPLRRAGRALMIAVTAVTLVAALTLLSGARGNVRQCERRRSTHAHAIAHARPVSRTRLGRE